MLIKIPDSWLREYLDAEVPFTAIAELLSLHGPTVETIEKTKDDVIYTLEITPNRSDLLSIMGLARETAAILNSAGRKANFKMVTGGKTKPEINTGAETLRLDIQISDPTLISAAKSVIVSNLNIKPSPSFIKERLEKCGVRSLNNVIDISNYVMLETGMPLHIFDYDLIKGHKMTLRESQEKESLVTLDGVKRELPSGSIVIEDEAGLIDLCGIMGAENSAIRDTTTRGVIWVERYNPLRIRRTFRTLNLATEAALRFEKYLDSTLIPLAFNRTLELLIKHADAQITSEIFTLGDFEYKPHVVEVELPLIQKYIGERLEINRAIDYLKSLEIEVEVIETPFLPPKIKAHIPSHRAEDINIAEDLVEEIARMFGLKKIQSVLPTCSTTTFFIDKHYYWEDRIKEIFSTKGYYETVNYSFVSLENLNNCLIDTNQADKIANPLNQDFLFLRPSLLCNLLKNLKSNQHLKDVIKLFELERVSHPSGTGDISQEDYHLTGIHRSTREEEVTFFEAKNDLCQLFNQLKIKGYEFKPTLNPPQYWQENKTADVMIAGELVGQMGYLNQKVLDNYGIEGQVVAFDFLSASLIKQASSFQIATPVIQHPPVIEDITVVAPKNTYANNPQQIIQETLINNNVLKQSKVYLIDYYKNEKTSQIALTFRIEYQSMEQTPDPKAVKEARTEIVKALKNNNYIIKE